MGYTAHMKFLQTIRSTAYNPSFYTSAQHDPLSQPIKLFGMLGLCGVGIMLILSLVHIFPFSPSQVLNTLESTYPDDLIINVINGELSINQPQPYYIKNTFFGDMPKYLVIFDADQTLSNDVKKESTFSIIRKTYMISDNSNDARITKFSDQKSTTTITKSDVVIGVEKIRPYVMPILIVGGTFAVVLFTVLFILFWIILHMLYVLIPALFVYLYSHARGESLQYRQSYLIALYASVPVVIASFLLTLVNGHLPTFTFTLLLLLIVALNMGGTEKETQASIV